MEENYYYANSYLHTISPVIARFDGFIGEFFGNGVLAVFPTTTKGLEAVSMVAKTIRNANRRSKHHTILHSKTITIAENVDFALEQGKPKIISDLMSVFSKIDHASQKLQGEAIFNKKILDQLPLEH